MDPDTIKLPNWNRLLAAIFLLGISLVTPPNSQAEEPSDIELVNFAFANYLGTGFYTSSKGSVFILKVPLKSTLKPMTSNDPGWVLKYPVSIGVTNFEEIVGGQVPELDDVGTVSFVPGIEYHYPVYQNWTLVPFFDLGIARDYNNNDNVRILGCGVMSFANFDFDRQRLLLGNRLLYADEMNLETNRNSSFAVFETGLDYNIPTDFTLHGSYIDFSLYYINYYYIRDIVVLEILDNSISLQNKNELGFTVSLPDYAWLPDSARLGLGVQFTSDNRLYRLLFGMPFF
jgi:hypothetical protein